MRRPSLAPVQSIASEKQDEDTWQLQCQAVPWMRRMKTLWLRLERSFMWVTPTVREREAAANIGGVSQRPRATAQQTPQALTLLHESVNVIRGCYGHLHQVVHIQSAILGMVDGERWLGLAAIGPAQCQQQRKKKQHTCAVCAVCIVRVTPPQQVSQGFIVDFKEGGLESVLPAVALQTIGDLR